MMRLAQLAGRSFRHAGPVSHPPGLLSPTFFSQVRNYAHRGEVTCSHVTIQLGPPFEVQVAFHRMQMCHFPQMPSVHSFPWMGIWFSPASEDSCKSTGCEPWGRGLGSARTPRGQEHYKLSTVVPSAQRSQSIYPGLWKLANDPQEIK